MVRDGDLTPTDYLTTATAHLPEETDLAIVQGVLGFARTHIADRYTTPPHQRPTTLAAITHLCRDLIRRTEDGDNPGLRLTAVRHYIDAATQPDTITAWLHDGTVPGGPELDPELRWRILTRLAVLGATDDTTITAELDRDPTATGQEAAARRRAALPDPDTKAHTWNTMFHTDTLSNYLFTATAQGFWQPEQTDLLHPYIERYYPDAVALAHRRGPAIAEAAGHWAFPTHAVTPHHPPPRPNLPPRPQPHPRTPPQTRRPTRRPRPRTPASATRQGSRTNDTGHDRPHPSHTTRHPDDHLGRALIHRPTTTEPPPVPSAHRPTTTPTTPAPDPPHTTGPRHDGAHTRRGTPHHAPPTQATIVEKNRARPHPGTPPADTPHPTATRRNPCTPHPPPHNPTTSSASASAPTTSP
ncbi:hypothetical protein GCM10020256_58640 [Streptomyces thermocoprophilus]